MMSETIVAMSPPAQLTFYFSRAATGAIGTVAAPRVAGSNPPRYEFEWNVTQEKGRRQIQVQGYKSNTASFKVDKRKQIRNIAAKKRGRHHHSGHAARRLKPLDFLLERAFYGLRYP